MMPLPMVVATAVPASAPTVFISPAMSTAANGVMTRVEITVATVLAASFIPLA